MAPVHENLNHLTAALGITLAEQLDIAFKTNEPTMMKEFFTWQNTRLLSHGYSREEIEEYFANLRDSVIRDMRGETRTKALKYFDFSLKATKSEISPSSPIFEENKLAREYTTLLLGGERQKALKLILTAVENGVPVQEIYLSVFQPSLYEIGRLWQINEISIAQEHFFTAATQMIMSQLYPFIFSAEKNGWKMVAASVDSNMHDIGIRMVADFFEMNGWDTFYLGANAPHQAILEAVQSYAPNLVAISATISRQVLQVEQAINGIRELPGGEKIKIIVGGAAFNTTKDLWKQIKADGYAVSADGAVELANRLIKDSRS